MNLNIDVIGGSGFIGSRLVKRLQHRKNFFIKIIDKVYGDKFDSITALADVRYLDQLQKNITGESVIVNLAAEHRDDVRPVSLYDDVNVNGAINICAVAREKSVRTIIFTSTVAVYGFSPVGTDERGKISPNNHYGRTKYEAEEIFKKWQTEDPENRVLVIIRPTVVFGEQNRGNVYNLLHQVASKRFIMIGDGKNHKSMAYVENVAAFIEYSMGFEPGVHVYNYIDKPDLSMNDLVGTVKFVLGRPNQVGLHLPTSVGILIGKAFDLVAAVTGRRFPISAIRVRKFCKDSVFNSSVGVTGFIAPVALQDALVQTIRHEFIEQRKTEKLFYSE